MNKSAIILGIKAFNLSLDEKNASREKTIRCNLFREILKP